MTLATFAILVAIFTAVCCFSNAVRYLSRFVPAGDWQPLVDAAREGRVRLHESGSGVFPTITQARVDDGNFLSVPGWVYCKCQAINDAQWESQRLATVAAFAKR